MNRDSLNQLRDKIKALDLELLRLLNERASVALQIGELKAEEGLDICDPWREQTVFSYLAQHNRGPLTIGEIEDVFKEIVSLSRKLQSSVSGTGSDPQVKLDNVNGFFAVTGETSLYGIVGNPVKHSMSPLMHNTAFRLCGLDAIYLPFEVDDLPGTLTAMKVLGIKGASVTHPFKEEIISLVDEIDGTAEKIGAVNTLVFRRDSIYGTNTDWVGAIRCLEILFPIEDHSFVVVGAGGAARAVVFGITSEGGKPIIVNRSEKKGCALAEEFGCPFASIAEIESLSGDCLVNTTPVGMYPQTDEMPVPKGVLGSYKAVVDVIYNPFRTKLLNEAEAAGCKVVSGFEMFVYQGVEQFSTWTGERAPAEEMRQVVYDRLTR